MMSTQETIVERLLTRAQIRREIPTRKSVINNEPDRIADLLEEAAKRIQTLEKAICIYFIEELGNMNFESDKEVIDYIVSFTDESRLDY